MIILSCTSFFFFFLSQPKIRFFFFRVLDRRDRELGSNSSAERQNQQCNGALLLSHSAYIFFVVLELFMNMSFFSYQTVKFSKTWAVSCLSPISCHVLQNILHTWWVYWMDFVFFQLLPFTMFFLPCPLPSWVDCIAF